MNELPSQARVVIVGGGVVGVSCAYHLAKAGWTDCVLLEKNELTAGSTWHAAGNVPTFSTSWSIMNMQRYSTELYSNLGDEVDYPMNYNVTGSIRLGHSKERMQEFQRAKGMGLYQGMNIEILDNNEIKKLYPFIETLLGLCFLFQYAMDVAAGVTVVLLLATSWGVLQTLRNKQAIQCACLGTALKLPMTEATLIENFLMIVMALGMLLS